VDVQNENSTKEYFEPLSAFVKGKINWVGVVSFGNALDNPLYVHQIGTTQIHLQPGYEAVRSIFIPTLGSLANLQLKISKTENGPSFHGATNPHQYDFKFS